VRDGRIVGGVAAVDKKLRAAGRRFLTSRIMILRADDMLFYLAGEERALERTFEWIWAGDKWATQHMRRGSTLIGGGGTYTVSVDGLHMYDIRMCNTDNRAQNGIFCLQNNMSMDQNELNMECFLKFKRISYCEAMRMPPACRFRR
jgi:hypothetical protein